MRGLLLFLAFCAGLAGGDARAHESRPLYIEVSGPEQGSYVVRWMTPASVDASNMPGVSLGGACVRRGDVLQRARQASGAFDCTKESGAPTLLVDWPVFNPSISTIVRVHKAGNEIATLILDPAQNAIELPLTETTGGVAKSYFALGVEHILAGVDHVLFLAGLLFIAGSPRRTLMTVTGFTIAHSITLGLVAMRILTVSIPATEAVIALSIVFLATEIARNDRSTLAWRRPILVAALFGLAHGAGFATALGEIGLPAGEQLTALLFFNLGVEAGQVALVAAVFGTLAALRMLLVDTSGWRDKAPVRFYASYAVGTIAAFWLFERLAGAANSG
jgi:hydrogenase/urease accessory protein HupE